MDGKRSYKHMWLFGQLVIGHFMTIFAKVHNFCEEDYSPVTCVHMFIGGIVPLGDIWGAPFSPQPYVSCPSPSIVLWHKEPLGAAINWLHVFTAPSLSSLDNQTFPNQAISTYFCVPKMGNGVISWNFVMTPRYIHNTMTLLILKLITAASINKSQRGFLFILPPPCDIFSPRTESRWS